MRRFGRGVPSRSAGRFDRLLVIGLGLGAVLLGQAAWPFNGDRTLGAGGGRPAATATPARVPGANSSTALPTGDAPTPSVTAAATPSPPYWRITSGGGNVNMRAAPSRTAPIVREMPDNEVVTNLDQRQTADGLTWQRVAFGTLEGWIDAALLVPQLD